MIGLEKISALPLTATLNKMMRDNTVTSQTVGKAIRSMMVRDDDTLSIDIQVLVQLFCSSFFVDPSCDDDADFI